MGMVDNPSLEYASPAVVQAVAEVVKRDQMSDDILSDEVLAEIERRAEAASEGPWAHDYFQESGQVVEKHSGGDSWVCQTWTRTEDDMDNALANGEFIAHARTDIPALLRHARTLQAERDGVIEQLDRWRVGNLSGTQLGEELDRLLPATTDEDNQ